VAAACAQSPKILKSQHSMNIQWIVSISENKQNFKKILMKEFSKVSIPSISEKNSTVGIPFIFQYSQKSVFHSFLKNSQKSAYHSFHAVNFEVSRILRNSPRRTPRQHHLFGGEDSQKSAKY